MLRSLLTNSVWARKYLALSGLLLGCMFASPAIADDRPTLTIAVVPQYTPLFIHRNWRPLVERISEKANIRLKLKTYASFRQFLAALKNGEPDFAYLAPSHLVTARKQQGYEPLVRDSSEELIGIVVVNKDSPYKTIHDLKGKMLAFPSPNAFAASLYMRAWLQEKVGLKFKPNYVGTHDNVYRHVVHQLAEAGGGVNSTLASQPAALQRRLRVLYQLPGVAGHPLSVHPRISPKIRKNFVRSIFQIAQDPQGRELLNAIHFQNPIIANYQRDYAFVEELGLDKYQSKE